MPLVLSMTIASCFFFCAPTPNALISKSNITWRPHLVSSPVFSLRLSSSAKSISLQRSVSVLSATIDNGGDGGGGSGDGGTNDGDGEGGEDRERNRNEAIMLLAESGTGLESLPKDLAAAVESGRIPGSVITRFLELQRSAVMRWLMQFAGFRERLLADELFLVKLAMEFGVGVFVKTAAEYERRRDNFFNELEVVLVMAIMVVYLSAPTVSLRPSLSLTDGGISKFFHNCPDNAFQIAISGISYNLLQRLGAIARNGAMLFAVGTTISLVSIAVRNALIKTRRGQAVDQTYESGIESVLSTTMCLLEFALPGTSYTLLKRLGSLAHNGAKLFAVGATSSLPSRNMNIYLKKKTQVGNAVTNALKKARRGVYGNSEDEIKSVPIVFTSVAYGVYMAVSSNLRYKVLAGVIEQRLLEPMLHHHKPALTVLCLAVRTGNKFLGSLLWVDYYARFIKIQKSH